MQNINDYLDSIGLKTYTNEELASYMLPAIYNATYTEAIQKQQIDPKYKTIPAINTQIEIISTNDLEQVKIGAQVIACSFGGTNWEAAILQKTSEFEYSVISKRVSVIEAERRKLDFSGFVDIMVDLISDVSFAVNVAQIDSIAISLGFPHNNYREIYGIEAYMQPIVLPKMWEIKDIAQPYKDLRLGHAIMEKINAKQNKLKIKKVYLLNDTNSVAQYSIFSEEGVVQHVPGGFIFGTGINAAYKTWNLEIGKVVIPNKILEKDLVHKKAIEMGFVRTGRDINVIEKLVGGVYLQARLLAAAMLLQESGYISEKIYYKLKSHCDQTIISELASNQSRKTLYEENMMNEIENLYLIADRILKIGGQVIGSIISAVAVISGYSTDPSLVPIEGSVFWKGYGVKEAAQETINNLLANNKIEFLNASGLVGVGQLAMVENSKN